MEPTDDRGTPLGREPVRFRWLFQDQDRPRFWSIYTGDPNFRPFFRYKVLVIIKGSLFARGQSWEGPWVVANGNGPLTISVPQPDSQGVVAREAPPIMVVDARGNLARAGLPPPTGREAQPAKAATIAGWDAAAAPSQPSESTSGPAATDGDGKRSAVERKPEFAELDVSPWRI